MSLFTTFYSYKGGVGRSLALANVAWLLANHPSEPARVLVIDFDLGAPGLHRVLGMKRPTKSQGLVDFVKHFVATASVPALDDFIHRTNYRSIDIIPAGKLDATYQRNLESLNWADLYEHKYGYALFERFKAMVSAKSYDYVLIDSLTGFSDVGGICVRQLPDTTVLLFRLNQQNLDGIQTVFSQYRNESSEANLHRTTVIPVITPAWPFIDSSSNSWLRKAQAVFGDNELSEISFEGGLSFGEEIISRKTQHSKSLYLKPKILSDYESLTNRLRASNVKDPLTIWQKIREMRYSVPQDTTMSSLLSLLKKRPNNFEYWSIVPEIFLGPQLSISAAGGKDRSPSKALRDFVDEQSEEGNVFALYVRSFMEELPFQGKADVASLQDLDKAVQLAPNFSEARMRRAALLSQAGRELAAIEDYKYLLLARNKKHIDQSNTHIQLANLYLKLFDASNAKKHFQAAHGLGERSAQTFNSLAKAYYFAGQFDEALSAINKSLEMRNQEIVHLLKAQVLAAKGEISQAKEILDGIRESGQVESWPNLAEAYLSIDPSKTLGIAEKHPMDFDGRVHNLLSFVARLMLNPGVEMPAVPLNEISQFDLPSVWGIFELVTLLRWKVMKGELSHGSGIYVLNSLLNSEQKKFAAL